MEGGFFPPGRGGNDPARQAAIQQLSKVPVSRPDVQRQGPMGQGPPGQGLGPGQGMGPGNGPQGSVAGNSQLGNEVAFHLSNAFEALTKTGPTPENLSAIKQFVYSISELAQPGQAQGGQAPGQQMAGGQPMGGQPPMGGPPQGQMQPGAPPLV